MRDVMHKESAAGEAQPFLDIIRVARKPWSEGAQIRNTIAPLWTGGSRRDVIRAAMIMAAVKKKPSQYGRLSEMLTGKGSVRGSAFGEDSFDNRGYSDLRGILAHALKGRKEGEAWSAAHDAAEKLNEAALSKHGPMQGVPMDSRRLLAKVPATYRKPWFEASAEGVVRRDPIPHNPRTGKSLTSDQMAAYEEVRRKLVDKWTSEGFKDAHTPRDASVRSMAKTSAVIPPITPLVEERIVSQVAPDIIQKAVGLKADKPNIPDIILQKAREMSNWEHLKGKLDPLIHGSEDPQALWDSFKEYSKSNVGSLTPWDVQNETDYRNALVNWVAHKQAPEGMADRLAADLLVDVGGAKTSSNYDPHKHIQRLDQDISKLKEEHEQKSSDMLKEMVRLRSKAEAPKTEAPKTEAPKTEAPKTEAPKNDSSVADKGFLRKALPYALATTAGGAAIGFSPMMYRAGKKEWDRHMKKAASDSSSGSFMSPTSDAIVGLSGLGVGALGAEAYRHGRNVSNAQAKGSKVLNDMRDLAAKGLVDVKNKDILGSASSKIESKNITPDHIRRILKPMDDYADMAQAVLSKRLMGTDLMHRSISAGDAAFVRAKSPNATKANVRGVAIASFLNTPDIASIKKYIPGVAMSPDDVAHTERTLAHMNGMATDPHATIARELASPMGDPRPGKAESRLNEWFAEGHPLREDALAILNSKDKRVSERFEPLLSKMEAILRDPASNAKLKSQVLARLKTLSSQLTGKAVSEPGALERYAGAAKVVGGLKGVARALKIGGGVAAVGGAGLAGAGLTDYLIGRKNKK